MEFDSAFMALALVAVLSVIFVIMGLLEPLVLRLIDRFTQEDDGAVPGIHDLEEDLEEDKW